MAGMIGFSLVIVGATSFASLYGWRGLFIFLLSAAIIALLLRARELRRL